MSTRNHLHAQSSGRDDSLVSFGWIEMDAVPWHSSLWYAVLMTYDMYSCTPQPLYLWSTHMPGKIQWSQHQLLCWCLAVWMLKMEKRKSSAVEFGHEVLMTNPQPIIFDRSKISVSVATEWVQAQNCHGQQSLGVLIGLSVNTFYDSILKLCTFSCVYVTCICFSAANWWLILCKAWWDFNLPGDCSCVVVKKRRERSQGSEPCDMFLQWKLHLDSRSSQLLKMAIACMFTKCVYIICEYDDM